MAGERNVTELDWESGAQQYTALYGDLISACRKRNSELEESQTPAKLASVPPSSASRHGGDQWDVCATKG